MKIVNLYIVLAPLVLATDEMARDDVPRSVGYRRYIPRKAVRASDRRQTKTVTVEKTVDDDSMDGSKSNTVTVEKNIDDDSTDGSTQTKETTSTRTKTEKVIPQNDSRSSTSTSEITTTSSSNGRKNSTSDDDAVSMSDDGTIPSNTSTPSSDLMDVLNENMDVNNATTPVASTGTIVLPPEHELSETWIIAIVTLFTSMAISLCVTTAIRRCRNKNRRTGYQEVNNIVV
jgi:hypothetical protein